MQPNSFNIYVMSYKRAKITTTWKLFEYFTYVVREEEEQAYRDAGISDLLVIPKGEAWSFMSTMYWIIEHTPEEVIYIADDDIDKYVYRMFDTRYLETKDKKPDKELITSEIERIAQIMYDLNIGLAFDQPTLAPYAYTSEFGFVGMPGYSRWINKKALKAKYNRGDITTSDIDMAMQELLLNRIILQPKYLCLKGKMDTNDGNVKDRSAHLKIVEAMKNKWGVHYDYNLKRNIAKIRVKR